MTVLIKSEAGNILKAEGMLWNQSTPADCDCPCLENSFDCETHTLTRANIICSDGSGGVGKWGLEWTATSDYNGDEISGKYILTFPEICVSWKKTTGGWEKTIDQIGSFTTEKENCEFKTEWPRGTPAHPVKSTIAADDLEISTTPAKITFDHVDLIATEKLTTEVFNDVKKRTVIILLARLVELSQYTEGCAASGCCSGDLVTQLYPAFNNFKPIKTTTQDGFGNLYELGYSLTITEHVPVFNLEFKGTEN